MRRRLIADRSAINFYTETKLSCPGSGVVGAGRFGGGVGGEVVGDGVVEHGVHTAVLRLGEGGELVGEGGRELEPGQGGVLDRATDGEGGLGEQRIVPRAAPPG